MTDITIYVAGFIATVAVGGAALTGVKAASGTPDPPHRSKRSFIKFHYWYPGRPYHHNWR